MTMEHSDSEKNTGPYIGMLGGGVPSSDGSSKILPPFLDGGNYKVTGSGGKDVGAFSATVNIPAVVRWTNRDSLSTIDRGANLTLTWSGGTPAKQLVMIGGVSNDSKTKATAGFFCFVPADTGKYTVPPSILGNLPAGVAANPTDSMGVLFVGTIPSGEYSKFTASGLDSGMLIYGALSSKPVVYK